MRRVWGGIRTVLGQTGGETDESTDCADSIDFFNPESPIRDRAKGKDAPGVAREPSRIRNLQSAIDWDASDKDEVLTVRLSNPESPIRDQAEREDAPSVAREPSRIRNLQSAIKRSVRTHQALPVN